MSMSTNNGISASNCDGKLTPDRKRRKCMPTLTHSSPAENNVYDEQLSQTIVDSLVADQVAIIFGFLKHNEIMYARICTTWRDAAKRTLVPPSIFQVKDVRSYNALRVMSSKLPNMQRLRICALDPGHRYSNGEDPDEGLAARTANYSVHDLNCMSNFRKLRILSIRSIDLNGKYPALFNFSLLQKLIMRDCCHLKWDLEILSGCPMLRELGLICLQQNPTGNLNSLRVLKNTLEVVVFDKCRNIHGNFMEMADFPRLKYLLIYETPVTGDIRDIKEVDFSAVERVDLPQTVFGIGGTRNMFQRISDVPIFIHAIHPLLKRFPKLFNENLWLLSEDSADFYDFGSEPPEPPFEIHPVLAGSRCGWRWCAPIVIDYDHLQIELQSCEVNWLDPEPSEDSDDYDKYVECLQKIKDEIDFYRGYYEPPTELEYRRLCVRERED